MATLRVPVNIAWTGSGSPGVNVWHVRTTSEVFDGGELQSAVDAIRAFYNTLNGGASPTSSMWAGGTTISASEAVDVATSEFRPVTWTSMTSGTAIGDLPPADQVCVTWRTSIAARRGMGRTFLGPLNRNIAGADGTIEDAWVTTVKNAAQTLVTASSAANGWAVGVYGYQSAPPPKPALRTDFSRVFRDITGARVRDQFAVLRSRRD